MRYYAAFLLLLLCPVLAACGEDDPASTATSDRLPHIFAPTDTIGRGFDGATASAAGASPDLDEVAHAASWQVAPPDPRWPRTDRLAYTHYRNDAFDFSIAYPDTVLKPRAEIGAGHGREFASNDGQVVALVYAVENASLQALDEQFQHYLNEPGLRITYQMRGDDWFVVAGRRGDKEFYEKTFLRGGRLKTFQIQYDTARARYFDVVTAVMGSSFTG